jgi:hypothetical protein
LCQDRSSPRPRCCRFAVGSIPARCIDGLELSFGRPVRSRRSGIGPLAQIGRTTACLEGRNSERHMEVSGAAVGKLIGFASAITQTGMTAIGPYETSRDVRDTSGDRIKADIGATRFRWHLVSPCPNCPFYFARRTSPYGSCEFAHFTLVTVRTSALL